MCNPHLGRGEQVETCFPFGSHVSESEVKIMRIEVSKKEMLDALKNVEMKGKWTSVSGLSSKGIGNYVVLTIRRNSLVLVNADASTLACKNIDVETEDAGSFDVEIPTLRKYLSKMGEELKIVVDNTVVMTSEGKKATMPIVVQHPYQTRINAFMNHWPITFNAELDNLIQFGEMKFDGAIQLTSEELTEVITACEIVNNGIYKFNYSAGDGIVNDKLMVSSSMHVSSYSEEIVCENTHGESSTVLFSGPLHKFFNKGETVNVYIGDDNPIMMVSETGVVIRAPRVEV